MVFDQEGRRRVCTPYLDTTAYGNLRFHFTMGTRPGAVRYMGGGWPDVARLTRTCLELLSSFSISKGYQHESK